MKEIDYSIYEKKEVKYIFNDESSAKHYGKTHNAFVIGCDYNIGITIISKDDKNFYLLCLNGPSSPNFKDHKISEEKYNELFNIRIEEIKIGTINSNSLDGFWGHDIGNCTMAECAFSQ